jgi:2-keto-3-deoxy-L-rhamnonate aldolase RhmA
MNSLDKALSKRNSGALLGLSVYSYDPLFVDLISRLGFDALWIEMEHGPLTFAEAGDLCRIASGLGLLTMVRIADTRRENVLKAAELDPDVLDVPMVNTPELAAELVRHARYSPEGQRGYFSISRAMHYGVVGSVREEQHRVNESLCLMVQIETAEAVSRAGDICGVRGIDAIFLGPGDLSTSLGVTGETTHAKVVEAMEQTVRTAKESGKRVAMACAPSDAPRWGKMGVDLLFCGGNISCLRFGAEQIMEKAAAARKEPKES